jgi:4-oxalocrotonate tautomerase
MPYVNVQILTGASVAQKRALVSDITQSLVMRLGKQPEHIHVVIEEVAPDNWGYAGLLTTEFLRRQEEAKVASPGRAKKIGRTKVRPASQ